MVDEPPCIFVLQIGNGGFVPFPGEEVGELMRKQVRRLVEAVEFLQNWVERHVERVPLEQMD
jgi:hypothetical protein